MLRLSSWSLRVLTFAVAALTASAALAQAPSLAELARKEAERRKALPAAPKVYTNKDLPESALKPPAAPAEPSAVASSEAGAGAAPAEPPSAPQGETKDESWWKGRVTAAREEVRRNEMFAEALQSRINALTRDFSSRDNPVQRRAIGEQRIQAVNELSRVMQDIERGKKQIADIEEEARQAGVPPGWLR